MSRYFSINQLFSINHEILSDFNAGLEIRGLLFLDISKVFDKVRHTQLIYKLCQNGISKDMLNTFK